MKLVSHGSFDRLQQALAEEIIRVIKAELEKVDAPEDVLKQLTGDIAFSITSLLDDVAGFENEAGEEVSPVITFQVADEELESCGGNTWMHEYVHRLLPRVFEKV